MNYFFYTTKKILGFLSLKLFNTTKIILFLFSKLKLNMREKKFINDKEMISIKLF